MEDISKLDILKKYFNYDSYKPNQLEAINAVLDKKDTLIFMKTGEGKSLCYQIPSLITKKITIVISPLISLINEQVKELNERGIPTCFWRENDEILSGEYLIIYTTPEKIINNIETIELLHEMRGICLFAIDECHCVSEWGDNFRSDYNKLGFLKIRFQDIPMMGLTATGTNKVISDALTILKMDINNTILIKSSLDRNNLFYEIKKKTTYKKDLMEYFNNEQNKCISTIIYTQNIKEVENIAIYLYNELNIKACSYYSNLDQELKEKIHHLFFNNEVHCIVATIAFGMGINKKNIRRIIHYGSPYNIEDYYQQMGRCGRNNKPSNCILFYSDGEFTRKRINILNSNINENIKDKTINNLNKMSDYVSNIECRRKVLLNYFGEAYINNCNNCDNCCFNKDNIEKKIDLTKEIKLLLKTIKLTGEIYGSGIILNILRGSKNKLVLNKNLDEIETYGKGKYKSKIWWNEFYLIIKNMDNIIEIDKKYGSILLDRIGNEYLLKEIIEPINVKSTFEL